MNGWFSGSGNVLGAVKLSVDMAIGETSKIESEDKGKIDSIVGKVRELNGRLQDIRREQVFQRVSHTESTQPPLSLRLAMFKISIASAFPSRLVNIFPLGTRSRIP